LRWSCFHFGTAPVSTCSNCVATTGCTAVCHTSTNVAISLGGTFSVVRRHQCSDRAHGHGHTLIQVAWGYLQCCVASSMQ
jgi:hypothetical protein